MRFSRLPASLALAAILLGTALNPAAAGEATVVVRTGETLTGISARHGVPIAEIVRLNGLANANRIYAGQVLRLTPAAAPTAAAPTAPAAAAPAAQPTVHVVKTGENLTWIARRHGSTVAAIAAANKLANPSQIFVGQRLTIPGASTAAAARPASTSAMPAKMAALVAKRAQVGDIIAEEARRFDVPVAFARALAWQESGWQPSVVSSAGAVGVMQLLPATGEWVGEAMLGETVKLGDTRSNIRAGVALIAFYLDRYDGDKRMVLAAYYQGMTAADRHGVYAVTQPYVASILALERLFGAN